MHLVQTVFLFCFVFSVFDPRLVESIAAEPVVADGQLYMSYTRVCIGIYVCTHRDYIEQRGFMVPG